MLKAISVIAMFLLLSVAVNSQVPVPSGNYGKTDSMTMGVDRAMLIAFAKQYEGTRYRKAGSSPKTGFDCSGFVNYVFRHFNVSLPRSSKDFKTLGTSLKPEDFRVGDVLVFYSFRNKARIGHVGIICEADGMKSRFIHAESGSVRKVTISHLDAPAYRGRFFKCLSVIR